MKGHALNISYAAIDLIKKHQGLSLEKYRDENGLSAMAACVLYHCQYADTSILRVSLRGSFPLSPRITGTYRLTLQYVAHSSSPAYR